jgi:transcriptional regulator with XRE-family HTH domain
MDKLAKRIGRKVVEIRKRRGMTAEKLAYENDLSKGYLSDIENGKRLPSLKLLDKIAKALDVDIRDLF